MDGEYRLARFRDSAAHKALKGAQYAREILEAGFTSCRNVGAGEFADVALRDAINGGYVPGPRLQVATHGIGITGGHCDANGYRPDVFGGECGIRCGVADGPEEVRRAVRYAVKYGADVIKTCATGGVLSEGDAVGATQYSSAELEVMVEEAHNADRRVAAHAHGTEGIKRAIRAGVASIEHGSILDDEAIALMVLKGTYLVPTLYVGDAVLKMADEGEGKLPPGSAAKAREIVPQMRASFRRAAAAGVKIAFGTDVGVFPHRDAAREFARLVGEGLSPMRAILAATREAATLMGWEDRVGTLEAGKFADLIAVKGDPLQEIRVLEEVRWVLKGGVVVKAPE